MEQFLQNYFTPIIILVIWSLIWKGLALWKSARAGQMAWFVVLLVINTLGILEMLYIFIFSRKQNPPQTI